MNKGIKTALVLLTALIIVSIIGVSNMSSKTIDLPEPELKSATSVEEALESRRSVRSYKDEPVTKAEVSQLLWAAQGITDRGRFRTAPSAGATYPLNVYVVAGNNVEGLEAGVYKYNISDHKLELIENGDKRPELMKASLRQSSVGNAPFSIIITGIYGRTTGRYGERGKLYTHIEVGHAAQNVALQCRSLGLGTVYIGAFSPDDVADVIDADSNEIPFAVLPVGRK